MVFTIEISNGPGYSSQWRTIEAARYTITERGYLLFFGESGQLLHALHRRIWVTVTA